MPSMKNTGRLLGAAFLLVILTSVLAAILHTTVIDSEEIADILVAVADDPDAYRFSLLAEVANGAAILVLAMMLYTVLSRENKILARIALAWWLAEGISVAISKLGGYALIPISEAFVAAGQPADSSYLATGQALYEGIDRQGYTLHMLFYCLGGIVWYTLFFRSRFVPAALGLFGIVAAGAGLAGIVVEMLGNEAPMAVYVPIGLFELVIGFWLLVRGVPDDTATVPPA